MKLIGTPFQIRVWKEITNIPKGKTKTYKEIAIKIGHPNSARAVANACGKNPYPGTIPCHRVVRSDGKIGGYSGPGGVTQKKRLLQEETEVGLVRFELTTSSLSGMRSNQAEL